MLDEEERKHLRGTKEQGNSRGAVSEDGYEGRSKEKSPKLGWFNIRALEPLNKGRLEDSDAG
jgi:hypothetical protein